jgi:NTE family protein
MISTMMEAHDTRYIQRKNFDRTIPIPTMGVKTTDFGIRPHQADTLRQAGHAAAELFFKTWDFQAWIQEHRLPEVLVQKATSAKAHDDSGAATVLM